MKKLLLLLCAIATYLQAAEIFSIRLDEICGVSAGYSYRNVFIANNKMGINGFGMHTGRLSAVSNNGSRVGLGFILGFTAEHNHTPLDIADPLFKDHYQLSSLDSEKHDFMMAGFDVRGMIPLPFPGEDISIINSYVTVSAELGYLGFEYLGRSGGFNKFSYSEQFQGGGIASLNLGAKLFILEFYGGIGCLYSFYSEGMQYDVPENDSRNISNRPDRSAHFVSYIGIGFSLDLYSD